MNYLVTALMNYLVTARMNHSVTLLMNHFVILREAEDLRLSFPHPTKNARHLDRSLLTPPQAHVI